MQKEHCHPAPFSTVAVTTTARYGSSDRNHGKWCGAPIPWTHHISETISSPFRGAFHRSLTVLSAIDLCTCLALDGGPPGFRPDYTCPTLLRNSLPLLLRSRTGLSPSLAARSRDVLLATACRMLGSCNPHLRSLLTSFVSKKRRWV